MVELEEPAGRLAIGVCPETGGELRSLRVKRGRRWFELLHAGSPSWRGGAPWLFPAVGRSAAAGAVGHWRVGGRLLPMPIHGFVMDRGWELSQIGGPLIACRTTSDADTRKLYPFDFALTAEYSFDAGAFVARAVVEAASSNAKPMPFSLGNHLTLALPVFGEGEPGQARLRTPAGSVLKLSKQGLLTGESEAAPYFVGARLADDPRLMNLVLGAYPPAKRWVEVLSPTGLGVRLSQSAEAADDGFRFVFWSDGKSFFCPEPWLGEPDSLNTGRGVVSLPPGQRFTWEMRLSLVGKP